MKAVLQWVLRTMMKDQTGIVRTMPKKDLVDFNVAMTAERLMRNGVDPNALKNANQVENALNQIDAAKKADKGITKTKSAKVFDMEGKEIPKGSKIMGGKAIDDDLPPPGSRGGADDIAAPVQSSEETIKNMIEAQNKKNISKMRNRKMVDDAIDNVSPGFVKGDRKYNAQLVAEELAEKKFGKEFYDLDQRQQMDLYDEALDGLSVDPNKFAQGGRAGFSKGSGLKSLFNFLNENNPVQAYKKYLESVKTRMKAGKEAEVAGEVIPIAAGGALITNQMKKVLKKMNEEQKKRIEEEAQEELRKDMKKADGGRAGFANGSGGLLDILNIQAEGSKTGKQQIKGAPEGFTADSETYNFILNADIPINEKINLLTKYGRDKGRTKIEKDGKELFLGEGGSRIREIGLDINPDAEKGFSGNIMYNPDSNNVKGGITYKFADGGRIGFKDGMTRRTFLKILGGAMSIPIIGKFLAPMKVGKTVTKVPMIKTDNVPGKPEWFDALVNKVIMEGDDVTKKFATAERQSIHQKTLDDGSVVRVTEDVDDGAVRVEYESEQNVFGDPVQMEYKKPLPDEGDPKPKAEFTTAESGPVGRQQSPDDYDIEIDEVGGTSIRDLDSDVSKLKEYATGKGPTMKEFIQNKKRRDKAQRITEDPESRMDAVIARQGEMLDDDFSPDFASGGIAKMLGE